MRDTQHLEQICEHYGCFYKPREIVSDLRKSMTPRQDEGFNNSFIGSMQEFADIEPIKKEKSITKGMSAAAKALLEKHDKAVSKTDYNDPVIIYFPKTKIDPITVTTMNFAKMVEHLDEFLDDKEVPVIFGKDTIYLSYWSDMIPYLAS